MNDDCASDTLLPEQIKKKKSAKQLEAVRRWREKNKEKVLEYSRQYYHNNKEAQTANHRKWRADNKQHTKEYAERYERENKESLSEARRKYHEKNREARREVSRKYHHANKERRRGHQQAYRAANKDKLAATVKRYREANKDHLREYQKRRNAMKRKTDTLFGLSRALRNRVRNAVISKGVKKLDKTMELIGCDVGFLKEYLEARFSKGMNWRNYGLKGWHIDHIVPCASFDLSNETEQRKCFHYSNLRPIWAKENLQKSMKIITCQPELLL